jgi:hypothetical protein
MQETNEAKYVYSMFLMTNLEDEEGRKLGFDFFAELKIQFVLVLQVVERG